MRNFEYLRPETVAEACSLLERYGPEAQVIAGGQSLIRMMELRLVSPKYLVDISGLKELNFIRGDGAGLEVGAVTVYHELEASPHIKGQFLALKEAVGLIGDMQVRNLGTIGGSLSHADPHSDLPCLAVAYEAKLRAQGAGAARDILAGDFFVDAMETALRPGEILTSVTFPGQSGATGSAYEKFAWHLGDYPIVGVGCVFTRGKGGRCDHARVVVGAVQEKPVRCRGAEGLLEGSDLADGVLSEAAKRVGEEINPIADPIYGSPQYKREVAKALALKALKRAKERAGVEGR